jgi:hypothetical protein
MLGFRNKSHLTQMKPNLIFIALALLCVTGCWPVRQHVYFIDHRSLTPKGKDYYLEVTAMSSTPNESVQIARWPGTLGFVFAFRSKDFKTPLFVTNLTASYTFERNKVLQTAPFVVYDIPRNAPKRAGQFYLQEYLSHLYLQEFYMLPTTNFIKNSNSGIRKLVKPGRYMYQVDCTINGSTNQILGGFDYHDEMEWKIGHIWLGWTD